MPADIERATLTEVRKVGAANELGLAKLHLVASGSSAVRQQPHWQQQHRRGIAARVLYLACACRDELDHTANYWVV